MPGIRWSLISIANESLAFQFAGRGERLFAGGRADDP
jgi:hypothetical protein